MLRRLSLLGAAAVLAGCASAAAPTASTGGSVTAPPAADGEASELTITMTEFAFSPGPVATVAGPVTFHVANDGVVPHQLAVSPMGEAHDAHLVDTGEVAAGEQQTVTVDLAPGTYEIACHVPGHFEAGMVTTLTVAG